MTGGQIEKLEKNLNGVELKSKHIILQLLDCCRNLKVNLPEEQQSPKVENNTKTHLKLTKKLFKSIIRVIRGSPNEEIRNSINDPSNWLTKGNLRPRDKAVIFYIQDIEDGVCQHSSKSGKTVDHLANRCEKRLDHNYTIRHNEVLQRINLLLLNRYHFESSKQIRSHSVQKILDNEVEIIPCVVPWDGIVTKYYKMCLKKIQIFINAEECIESIILEKIVKTISFDPQEDLSWTKCRRKQPTLPLKQVDNDANGSDLNDRSSEKQKEKIIKAANRASEVDVVIRECKNDQGIPQPSSYTPSTIINNTSISPSEANTNTKVCLLNTIPSPSNPMHSSTVTPWPDIAANGPNLCTIPISESLVVLRSILRSIEAERQEFIRCVFFAVQTSYYNEKFSCTETIDVLKRMAHNKTEEEIRQEENGERRRIATCLAEPCSLTDATRFISLREKYLSNIKKISEEEIGKVVVRTRKLPNELVDTTVLDLINRIVGEYADYHVPMTITDIARIIQTAQVCYDDETRKERPRSAWKESFESKISVLKLSKDILE
ncbi:hypothetical protein CWI38_1450p0010, partial [Hamiltosporidium tvaerminnensis]